MIKKQNLEEYKLPYNSFVGGWFIENKVCDELIKFYKKNAHLHLEGKVLKKNSDGVLIRGIDEETKKSLDMSLSSDLLVYPTNLYFVELQKVLINYIKRYEYANLVRPFAVSDYNIQHYEKNEGYRKYHCERVGLENSDRHLVFMTYLNDVPDGGTEFLYQNLTVSAKKGLTVIWPSDWTHIHRGQVSKNFEKYIVTGWFKFKNLNERY
jgi:hypothetical protein